MYVVFRLNDAYIRPQLSDIIFQICQFGKADKQTLLKHLGDKDRGWMDRELAREAMREGTKPWYNVPLNILSQIVFKVMLFICFCIWSFSYYCLWVCIHEMLALNLYTYCRMSLRRRLPL